MAGLSPSLKDSLNSAIKKAREPITPAQFENFCNWVLSMGLPAPFSPDGVTFGDYSAVRAVITQRQKCANCDGNFDACDSKTLYIQNDIYRIMTVPCPTKNARRLIKLANVPAKFAKCRFEDFKVRALTEEDLLFINDAVRGKRGLYIYGAVGTGKSMLSSIIINERAFDNRRSHFYTVTDMLADLGDYDNPERRNEKLLRVKHTPCLVIDDIGAEYVTKWVSNTLFNILDFRYREGLQTIYNSNFPLDKLCARYEGIMGDRIARRIYDTSNSILVI